MSDLSTDPGTEAALDQLLLRVDAAAYREIIARFDAPPRPNEALCKLMQTPAPWD